MSNQFEYWIVVGVFSTSITIAMWVLLVKLGFLQTLIDIFSY